jgi:hypothetical protein
MQPFDSATELESKLLSDLQPNHLRKNTKQNTIQSIEDAN